MRVLFAVCLALLAPALQAQNKIDVLHYTFNLELNDKNDTIYGEAEIFLTFREATSSFKLDLVTRNSQGRGMIIDKITGPGIRDIVKSPDSVRIMLNPGATMRANDTAMYVVTYHGIPEDGLIISTNKFGNRTFFSDNWPNRAHYWIPCSDDPADKATVEFIVTAPSHYQVVSNGIQTEETNLPDNKKLTRYREDVPLPTKVMVIGAADFAVQLAGDVNCVPVTSWVYPENKSDGFDDYAMAREILAYHINYIGPYAYKKLANVQSKTRFGGMENAGAIFYAEYSVSGQRQDEELLSHEIVHQWFGNMATEKSFAHFWLSEGFATYLTHIYIESKYGTDSLNREMRDDREKVLEFVKRTRRPVVDATRDYMSLLNANSYQKGSWVLHMLRRQLGDSVFHQGIRAYYAAYAGKNADTKDLQKIFEAVSGRDLEQFFRQWLYTPENPSLDMTWYYDPVKKEVQFHIKQVQATTFQFPLTISLIAASGAGTNSRVMVEKKESDFTFSFPEKPKQLVADPFTSLLFAGKISELK